MPKPTASANIRAELARADVSQSAVADLLGISPGQVSARIQGRIEWRLSEVQAIAAHLNVPIGKLVEDEPADASPAVAS